MRVSQTQVFDLWIANRHEWVDFYLEMPIKQKKIHTTQLTSWKYQLHLVAC